MHTLASHLTRILVLGSSGQVAQALQHTCPADMVVRAVSRTELDLADLDALASRLEQLIQAFKPHFVVNAAAYTAVDQAETDQATATAVNALAPGMIARVLTQSNIPLLHYSTDYVFDGQKLTPYNEDDATNPLSVYGSSKLGGEKAITAVKGKSLILRTSWVFSEYGSNFLKTMLRLASARDALGVIDDQVGSPTSAALIASISFLLVREMLMADEADPRWGLYHMTAASSTSWYGYARYVISQARERGALVQVNDEAITPLTSAQYPTAAVRPKNSRLETTKLQRNFGVQLPAWQIGVDEVLEKLLCES